MERRQATDPRRTTGIRASDRDPSEPVGGPRTAALGRGGYPPYRYKRVTALRMRAWRWHGGPSTHIRHMICRLQSADSTATSTTTGRDTDIDGPGWALGEASWRERAQRTQLWHNGGQSRRAERYLGAEFERANSVCLTRCSPVGQLVTVARQGN